VFWLVVIAFDVNLYQSVVWLLMPKRNFYQSVPPCPVPSWRCGFFMQIMYPEKVTHWK